MDRWRDFPVYCAFESSDNNSNTNNSNIFGIGGTDCTNRAYEYDLINDNINKFISNFTINASSCKENFWNGDMCNAVLIGDVKLRYKSQFI